MLRKFKGILLHTKASRENDLFIKLLTDSDEIISGIVYGGLSKKKKNILQIGYFLNINVSYKTNKPPSISAELTDPYIVSIFNDKFKMNCLLSTTSLLNISIADEQKIPKIFYNVEDFISHMINKKKWLIQHFNFLFLLLKSIGYEIDYYKNEHQNYFDTETLQFSKNSSNSSIIFPHQLLNNKEIYKISYEDINNLFHIFEIVFFKYHLSYLKLNLPNQYLLFKKLVIDKLINNV